MFCPNCGKDCGSAKFCPECGQKLQGKPEKEQKSSVWSVGMPCPHCGGTKLDGGCCAFCGAQLVLNEEINPNAEADSFVLPEIVVGFCRIINLDENSFTYRKNAVFSKKFQEFVISYSDIVSVTYLRDGEMRNALTIITKNSKMRRIEFDLLDRIEIGHQMFSYLKTVAPGSAEFIVDEQYLSANVAVKWMKRFDTEHFFNTYNPYLKRAQEKITELTNLSARDAHSVAAAVICKRQEALYKENPALAIRDLNRAIKECNLRKEERKRAQRELEARNDNGY